MMSVRQMERHAAWYASLSVEEKAAYDAQLEEHRRSLGLAEDQEGEPDEQT